MPENPAPPKFVEFVNDVSRDPERASEPQDWWADTEGLAWRAAISAAAKVARECFVSVKAGAANEFCCGEEIAAAIDKLAGGG